MLERFSIWQTLIQMKRIIYSTSNHLAKARLELANVNPDEKNYICRVPLQVPCGQGILGARLFEAKERRDHRYHQRGLIVGLRTARKGSFHSRYVPILAV